MPKRLDPEVAKKVMLEAGFQPLEPFKDSQSKWKSKCLSCKKIISIKYSHVKSGTRCRFCRFAARKLDPKAAEQVMLKVHLQPIEPYKGSNAKWKSRCLKCGAIISARYETARMGHGCWFCGIGTRANTKRNSESKVFAILRKKNLTPLEPYKTNRTKWKCECLTCGKTVYPRLSSLQKEERGGCIYCAARKRHLHFKKPEKEAISLARKAKVVPLEPYVNMNTKWKCRCLICDAIVTPRLADMKRHPKSLGCKKCANNIANVRLKLSDKRAISVMQKGGLQPLRPYVNAMKPWKSRCLECGRTVSPTLNAVRDGGGCRYCAKSGFGLHLPSYLYLVTNEALSAHKVGIANKGRKHDRLKNLRRYGWKTHAVWHFKTGKQAEKCERGVFKVIRNDLRLAIYLKKDQLPVTRGHTETMDANEITLKALERLIGRVIKGLQR